MSIDGASYGQRVKLVRQQQGLGLRELAKRAGTSASSISRWERGEEITLGKALAVMAALGIPLQPEASCPHEYVCRFCGEAKEETT